MNGPRTDEEAMAATSVFWDINHCPLPSGVGAREVAPRIKRFLRSLGYSGPVTINAVGTLTEVPDYVLQCFSSTGIALHHGSYFHVDMRAILVAWSCMTDPPANLMVISPHYSGILSCLSSPSWGWGFNVIDLPNYDQGPSSVDSLWNNFLLSDVGPLEGDMGTESASWVCIVCANLVGGNGVDSFSEHLDSPQHKSWLLRCSDMCMGCPDHPRLETRWR